MIIHFIIVVQITTANGNTHVGCLTVLRPSCLRQGHVCYDCCGQLFCFDNVVNAHAKCQTKQKTVVMQPFESL